VWPISRRAQFSSRRAVCVPEQSARGVHSLGPVARSRADRREQDEQTTRELCESRLSELSTVNRTVTTSTPRQKFGQRRKPVAAETGRCDVVDLGRWFRKTHVDSNASFAARTADQQRRFLRACSQQRMPPLPPTLPTLAAPPCPPTTAVVQPRCPYPGGVEVAPFSLTPSG
jgi:hypothetical protein